MAHGWIEGGPCLGKSSAGGAFAPYKPAGKLTAMGRHFEITRLAIGQTVLDPNFASSVAVARKFERAHDHDPAVALFETCVEYYAGLGPDTADLGMGKAIFLWNGLEDHGDLDELLDRQKQSLRQLMGLCGDKFPPTP